MVSVRPASGTKALPTPARQANADGMTSRVVHYEIPIDDPDQAGAFHRDLVRLERRRVGPVDYWTMTTAGSAADSDDRRGSVQRPRVAEVAQPRRYNSTASTLLDSPVVAGMSSLLNTLETYFSTARTVITNSSAIPWFDRPSAIKASTWRSR